MADLAQFREWVTIYRKRQVDPATGRFSTLEALAKAIGLSADELGHRLRGTGRNKLTRENVLSIVCALAAWEALSWEEAVALLICMEYPLDQPGWQTDLQRLLGPAPQSVQQTVASSVVLPGAEPSAPVRRRLFQACDLPKEYVPRPNAFNEIKRLLLTHEENQTTAITTALRGAGGFGKTTLALALCHDPEIQVAFPDGILWVELGEHPPGQLTVLNELLHVLEPSEREALTLEEARERWQHALKERSYLLVIDDVWQRGALKELLQGGSRCGRLITTRNDQLLPDEAKRVWVDAMEPAEAMALLCEGVIDEWQHTLDRSVLEEVVVGQLGCWPLLVSLARGMLKNQVGRLHKAPEQALARLQHAYDERGMTTFHLGDRDERQRNIDACLEVSLRQLEEWVPAHYQARQRYLELAVFPEDTAIAFSTLQIYWKGTGGLYKDEVEELCLHLSDLSLLLPGDSEKLTIRLHDMLRSYLIQRAGNQLSTLHQRLLDACQQHSHLTRWADLPQSEAYLWQRLVFHLCQAGQQEALQRTLTDLLFVTRKVVYQGVSALEADLALAMASLPQGEEEHALPSLASLPQMIRHSSHLLGQVASEAEVGSLLVSQIYDNARWERPRRVLEQELPRPYVSMWHTLPCGSSSLLIRTLRGHISSVEACAISPDGKWIVSASRDRTLKVWDSITGAERLTLSGHISLVKACAISPDGEWIVSASLDGTLKVWDSTTGVERLTLSGHTAWVEACAISPDGKWIVSASRDRTLKVWDSITGVERLTLSGQNELTNSCAISPDGKWIVSASRDRTLKVWDSITGVERLTLSGYIISVNGCVVSPDGKWIVSTSWERTLKVWDGITGVERLTLSGHTASVEACAVSPDGKWIVSASRDRTLKVWDSITGAERLTLSGHTGPVNGCAVSPDGKWIVSASADGTLKVWEVATRTECPTLSGHISGVSTCAVSLDGKWIVSASYDGTLKVWDSITGAEHLTLSGQNGWVNGCAISPDGEWIVFASLDGTLTVWEAATGVKRFTLSGHILSVNGCAISPDGKRIVSASLDGTLKVWETSTGAQVGTLFGHTSSVLACEFSPDGKWIVSASEDCTLKVWDSITGAERLTLSGHTMWVNGCAISPDGEWIVSASADGTLKVWEAATGVERLTLSGHTASIRDCAVSPDGKWIISASQDRTLKVWEGQTGQGVLTFPVDEELSGCAFHPDGEHLVAWGEQGLFFLRLVK